MQTSAPTASNGTPKLKTTVEVTGQYLLAPIDDSNERWSTPEWVSFAVVKSMCLLILIGGVFLLRMPDGAIDRDLRLMVTMLAPAAGFKLIESASQAANKRGPRTNGNGK